MVNERRWMLFSRAAYDQGDAAVTAQIMARLRGLGISCDHIDDPKAYTGEDVIAPDLTRGPVLLTSEGKHEGDVGINRFLNTLRVPTTSPTSHRTGMSPPA